MISGITVKLLQLSRAGSTPVWTEVTVDNVLVAPTSEVDSTVAALPDGHRALYHLAIPKSDQHRWEGQLVQFWGHTWSVIGIPTEGIDDLIPGPWNKKVAVELYSTEAPDINSLWRDVVKLRNRIIRQDASGYPGTSITDGSTVQAILPAGVTFEKTGEDGKQAMRAKTTAEIWEGDYRGEDILEYRDVQYEIGKISRTGRGTLLLDCTEVWR